MAPDSEPPSPAAAGPATAWLEATGDDPFAHPAVLYHDTSDYLAHTIPFLLDGLAEGEPAAVAVPGPNLTAIREELSSRGGQPEQVTWLDMTEAGRNPGRIIPSCSGPSPTGTPLSGCGSSGSLSGPSAAASSTRPAPSTKH